MRSSTVVYRADGTPITVVTIENRKDAMPPLPTPDRENRYELNPVIENGAKPLGPQVALSEHDRSKAK